MIYFTELLNPPLLLVVFGLRFSSRIKFSVLSTRRFEREAVRNAFGEGEGEKGALGKQQHVKLSFWNRSF